MIFDIGANRGDKTDIFSSIGKKVISVEPDKTSFEILNVRFCKNPVVLIENIAISDKTGESVFYILENGQELNTLSEKWKGSIENNNNERFGEKRVFRNQTFVKTMTLDDLIEKHGIPDYIKIDVEGYESSVLSGLSKKIKLLSFECNLPEFISETMDCINQIVSLSPFAQFNICEGTYFISCSWMKLQQVKDYIAGNEVKTIEIYCRM